MYLSYPKAKLAHIKGPYIYLAGGGKTVKLDVGEMDKWVPDDLARQIIARDGDIIKIGKAPAKKEASAPKTKQAEVPKNK